MCGSCVLQSCKGLCPSTSSYLRGLLAPLFAFSSPVLGVRYSASLLAISANRLARRPFLFFVFIVLLYCSVSGFLWLFFQYDAGKIPSNIWKRHSCGLRAVAIGVRYSTSLLAISVNRLARRPPHQQNNGASRRPIRCFCREASC